MSKLRKWWWWLAAVALLIAGAIVAFVMLRARSDEHAFRVSPRTPSGADAFGAALEQGLGVRLEPGHELVLLENGAVFDAVVAQISQAVSSIHVLMYIWERGKASDRVVAALTARAKAGVGCRVLVDDLGSPDFERDVKPALAAAGCEVRIFRPYATTARNHRKLVVADGHSAILGGFGIRDNWLGQGQTKDSWRDTNVMLRGPAVRTAQLAFASNWQEAGGDLLPPSSLPPATDAGPSTAAVVASSGAGVTAAERLTQLMLASAQKRIWIANAYFVPSRAILDLLRQKARAGVDVRVVAPDEGGDSKTAFGAQHVEYGSLQEAGVRVWEHGASMLHSKVLLIDDELLQVGSINLDPLSLNELEELALVARDARLSEQLSQSFREDCARSVELEK